MSATDDPKPKLDEVVNLVEGLLGGLSVFLDEFHRAYIEHRGLIGPYIPAEEQQS
jgi:hypothetical protein